MKKKIVHLPDIGTVALVKSKRAKYMNIALRPFQDIRVTVPLNMTYTQAEAFVQQRLEWIQAHSPHIQSIEKRMTLFDEQTVFQTRAHQLCIRRSRTRQLCVRTVGGQIRVDCPETVDITSDAVQLAIREGIERAWRKEAKAYLPERVRELAARHRFMYAQLRIKNIKSRWGSCSAANNINLSLHVMRLSDELIDYVILHELAHTIEKNHGQRFWTLLEEVCPGAKRLNTSLKQQYIQIY